MDQKKSVKIPPTFDEVARKVGRIVSQKNAEYGDAYRDCGDFLRILYPNGVLPRDYTNLLCLVRVFDKMKRIATAPMTAADDSWLDIAGYGVLMTAMYEQVEFSAPAKLPGTILPGTVLVGEPRTKN